MLTIPATYYNNNEDYITLTAIRSFMRNHPEGKFKVSLPREELLDSIIDFGNQNDSNSETVLNWIDAVLQEGIKDIYLQYAPISEEMQLLFTSKSGIENYLDAYRSKTLNHHVCMNTYGQQYTHLFLHCILKIVKGLHSFIVGNYTYTIRKIVLQRKLTIQ